MSRSLHYRPDIDGLRAIAVLSVIVYHLQSSWLPGGFIGVDIFFVISGFVVSAALAQSPMQSFGGFIAQFYARRLARIVPALVLVLTVSALLASLFIPRAWLSGLSEETALFAFWGLSNWRLQTNTDVYFAPRAEFNPYTQTWSLGVEEQFYLIVPVLLFLWVFAQHHHKKWLSQATLYILSALALASLAFCAWASVHQPAAAFYFIGARFWELACGALLFFLSSNNPTLLRSSLAPWVGAALICVGLIFTDPLAFPWPWALAPTVGTLCLIGGLGANTEHPLRRFLSQGCWVWIGKRSYSLYLWHWPVFVLLRWTTGLQTLSQYISAVVITCMLAILSYQWVEKPLRHNPWIEKHSSRFIIILFLALPLAGTFASQYFFTHLQQMSLSTVSKNAADWYGSNLTMYMTPDSRPCQVNQSFLELAGGTERVLTPTECQTQGKTEGQTIYVLGDSHAGAIIPLLEQTSAQFGITIKVFSFQGKVATPYACSYLDLQAPMEVGRAPGCLEFNTAVRDQIVREAKAGDIVLLSSLRMQRYGDQWASFDIENMQDKVNSPQAQQLRQAAAAQASSWLDPLTAKKIKVIFVAPTPIFKAPTFRCADWFNAHNPICVGQNQQAKAELETLRSPTLQTMELLSKRSEQILVWDPLPILCPDETCNALKDGRPLFFDGDHLSNYGNAFLYLALIDWMNEQHLIESQ